MLPRVVRLEAAIPPAHQSVFDFLLSVAAENKLKATLRVAGGWVRDMLLGLHSNDIDIAIETHAGTKLVTGEAFAHRVSEYQLAHGGRGHTVSVIRSNPALSKHIETATVRVHEIPVEFCALRTDVYTNESRIPQVRPAAPVEDAQRRDFTINALFYNLHTGMVEDYTTGLEDLRLRIIRCPLEPRTTFMDDPLRLLRGVRFVGQLGALNFSLDESITSCMDDALLQVLQQKVSRERVGKEFVKMMAAAHPERCIALLHDMHILQHVLLVSVVMRQVPGKKQLSNEIERVERLVDLYPDGSKRLETVMRLSAVGLPCLANVGVAAELSEGQRVEVALFFLVIPFFRGATESVEETVRNVCMNGLKLPLASCDCVRRLIDAYNHLHAQSMRMDELVAETLRPETVRKVFDALNILSDKHVFRHALQVVLLVYMLIEESAHLLSDGRLQQATSDFSAAWARVAEHPVLLDAFQLRLPINGKDLQKVYGIPPKNVGSTLLKMRLKLVLCPRMTPEDVAQWLVEGAQV
ncbi:tRNA nucleotidyltransferase [Leishmania donovani]|uniref:Poly A polymerase head domain family protein n=1 Tax=Leishmania donovani TaxID=5661 RepID=A0A504X440_LEIDO|nr:Poly A polymerase head domain family protein [Leishmania donovani]CAJ1985966.1 tRNA nucleotidyltransferase [Leishmania donovani]VDZ41869.1 tRNA_nucleotidyltransferase_putative/GeneDB:LmjF.04.1190 [Leishmania donovani]